MLSLGSCTVNLTASRADSIFILTPYAFGKRHPSPFSQAKFSPPLLVPVKSKVCLSIGSRRTRQESLGTGIWGTFTPVFATPGSKVEKRPSRCNLLTRSKWSRRASEGPYWACIGTNYYGKVRQSSACTLDSYIEDGREWDGLWAQVTLWLLWEKEPWLHLTLTEEHE